MVLVRTYSVKDHSRPRKIPAQENELAIREKLSCLHVCGPCCVVDREMRGHLCLHP